MSVTFTPIDLSERELESELMKNPSLIEDGLRALDHQIPTGQGFIDM